jgi:hypothetical protein
MITDIRNYSGNFSSSISSTPVGTTEIKNKPDAIACNTDETVSVAEIENKGDAAVEANTISLTASTGDLFIDESFSAFID